MVTMETMTKQAKSKKTLPRQSWPLLAHPEGKENQTKKKLCKLQKNKQEASDMQQNTGRNETEERSKKGVKHRKETTRKR